LVILAIWLSLRPYRGITHDGRLYLVQALQRLEPARFQTDLFFAFGSQDSYTIFTRLYAALLALTEDISKTHCFLLFCAQSSFLFFAWKWAVRLSGVRRSPWALAFIAASPFYGGHQIFSVGETFVTARSIAEPLILAALLLQWEKHQWAALFLILVATAMHPLMAGPGIVAWWIIQSFEDRRWLWAAPIAVATLYLLASWDLPPFDRLLDSYDRPWYGTLHWRSPWNLPSLWRIEDWNRFILDAAMIIAALPTVRGANRRFLASLLITGLAGIALSMLGSGILKNTLLTQLQFWRSHWLLHIAALCVSPWLAVRAWRQAGHARMGIILFAVSYAYAAHPAASLSTSLALILVSKAHEGPVSTVPTTPFGPLLTASLLGGLAYALAWSSLREGPIATDFPSPAVGLNFLIDQLRRPPLLVAAAFAAVLCLHATLSSWRRLGFAFVAILLGVLLWDQRKPLDRYFEHSLAAPRPFSDLIPVTSHVLWPEDVRFPWLLLRQPSFFSAVQGSGIVFNQGQAQEYLRRAKIAAPFMPACRLCPILTKLKETSPKEPISTRLVKLCSAAGVPTVVVLPVLIPPYAASEWRPEAIPGRKIVTYWLYDCRDIVADAELRQSPSGETTSPSRNAHTP
jgi:hypothetical protein